MEDIHIGRKIEELLRGRHWTKKQLADAIMMSQGNVVYLTKRDSVDVKTLHAIGNALKYNFWNYFPIDDGQGNVVRVTVQEKQAMDRKDGEIAELKAKAEEREKEIERLKDELVKQEIDYLREINGLLKRKG